MSARATRTTRRAGAESVDYDPRASSTHAGLVAALTALVQSKPLHAITISELVSAAGVARTTFYSHYPDLFAFAGDVCAASLDSLKAAADAGPEPVAQILARIQEDRPLYRLVFGPLDVGFRHALHEQATAIVSGRAADPLMATFLAGGVFAILENWANSDSTDVAGYAAAIGRAFAGVNQ
jgi:AcrR family transcriptional regulator